jgi:transposase InsO family protein
VDKSVIVTDYFSKYIEVERLTNKASSTVLNKIKKIFSRHGIPKELCTDNGPEYTASCFKRFAKEWDFKHTTSSPHFPKSNGLLYTQLTTLDKSQV